MAPRILRFKKTIVIASIAALSLAGAGAAFAYWTSTGKGYGTAQTGTADEFSIASAPGSGENLVPGGIGQQVAFVVINTATTPQRLTSVTVTIADEEGVPWVPPIGCDFAQYHAVVTAQPTPGDLAPLTGQFEGEVVVTLTNTPTVDQNACKGKVVPLHIVAA